MPKNNSMEVTDCPAWDQQPEPIRTRMALATGLPRVQYRQIDVTGKPFTQEWHQFSNWQPIRRNEGETVRPNFMAGC